MPIPMPPQVRSSGKQLRLSNQADFTGGLNYSFDRVDLAENELPDALNVDFDKNGGLNSRKMGLVALTASGTTINPACVVNYNGDILVLQDLNVAGAQLATFGSVVGTALAIPNTFFQTMERSFAEMGIATSNPIGWISSLLGTPYKITTNAGVITFTALTTVAQGGVFQDDYATPSGLYAPRGFWRVPHGGYMFSSSSLQPGGEHLARLRWSHPGDAGSWRSFDYIDVGSIQVPINGLYSMGDHLLILKGDSVWAVYGSSPETFRLVLISDKIGCGGLSNRGGPSCQGPDGVMFVDPARGPFLWNGQTLAWIGEKIANAFSATGGPQGVASLSFARYSDAFYGGNPGEERYQFSCKMGSTYYAFAWEPRTQAWSLYQYFDGAFSVGVNDNPPQFLQWKDGVSTMVLGWRYLGGGTTNTYYTAASGVEATATQHFRTAWYRGGQPSVRKTWRRPEFIYRNGTAAQVVTVSVYKDYDNSTVAKTMTTTPAGAIDANARLSSIGTAKAIALKFTWTVGQGLSMSISNLLLKFRTKAPRS